MVLEIECLGRWKRPCENVTCSVEPDQGNKNERQQSIADFLLFNITGCHENMREKIMLEGMLF
jgi:hypothetical protein